ncbi:hypothetical protein T07_4881 [Trichinella nelsoni]|uniref:Uncharacterized protein n=1 Tax=Trichinella nelsoni TaxID=6336 RepID=A0A0V0SFF7_9BILA|nr:hypothetical protein T07_4881 [Trichinella nelsoni]
MFGRSSSPRTMLHERHIGRCFTSSVSCVFGCCCQVILCSGVPRTMVAVHPGVVQCIALVCCDDIVSGGIISSRISDCHRIRSTYACFTAFEPGHQASMLTIHHRARGDPLLEDTKRVELIPHTVRPSNVAHQQTQSWFQSNLISAVRRLHELMGRFLN